MVGTSNLGGAGLGNFHDELLMKLGGTEFSNKAS